MKPRQPLMQIKRCPSPADIDLKYKRFADDRIRYFRAPLIPEAALFTFLKKGDGKMAEKKTLKIKNMN